jgi:UDP-N-acetylglucosamine/UDP-N-acetylgalactosamine diphosphorylase
MIPLLGKSLFQRICEKIPLHTPVAILTSPRNHERILEFFKNHSSFGLGDVSFFSQGTMPLLDCEGRWFWDELGQIAEGSDGNGSVFQALHAANLLSRWSSQGIEIVHIVPIDNPIANPLEPLLGCQQADLSFLAIRLEDPLEPLGRVVCREQKLAIIEYSELTPIQRIENLYANTGLYAFSLSFLEHLAKQKFPLHFVFRSSSWKGERFLVDALAYTERAHPIIVPRNRYYAALKEKKSIANLELLLLEREEGNRVYSAL